MDNHSACCLSPGCYDCEKGSELIQTSTVFTPFYRPILEREDIKDGIPAPETNYLPYDLFAFRTKFERGLYHINPTYHFSFVSKQINKVMKLTIDIYKGDTFVPLDPTLAKTLQTLVDECVATFPKLCVLLDSRIPIIRGTKTLTKAWVNSLFPFLAFEKRFRAIFDNGRIYIDLSRDIDYLNLYKKMYMKMIDVLFEYYKRGVIPLSPRLHNHIIEDWALQKVYEQYVKPGDNNYPGELALYEATWKNPHFATDMVAFLYDRIQNKPDINILVGDNFVRRHFVAVELEKLIRNKYKEMKEYIPTFSGKYVYVPSEDILQSFEITNTVVEAKSESTGRVEIVPLENLEDYEKVLKSILSGYPQISQTENIVLYQTFDVPKYILSFLIPPSEASDSLRILKTY